MKILNNTHPRTAVYGANLQESSSLVENYWELFPEYEGLFFFFPNQFFICISCIWSRLHFLNSCVKMPSTSKELHKSDYQIYLVLPTYPLGQLTCQEGNSDGLAYFVKSWQIRIALSLAPYYLPAAQKQINDFFSMSFGVSKCGQVLSKSLGSPFCHSKYQYFFTGVSLVLWIISSSSLSGNNIFVLRLTFGATWGHLSATERQYIQLTLISSFLTLTYFPILLSIWSHKFASTTNLFERKVF